MSEGEFKKIRLHLRLLTVCVLVLIALLTANLIHKNFNPKSTSFPRIVVVNGRDGKDGVSPQIDYSRIDEYINTQVASIPKPQNGVNGRNGTDGKKGEAGKTGATGAQGIAGAQGEPGTAGRELIIRYNPLKQETEYQYSGDLGWFVLVKNCQILGTC